MVKQENKEEFKVLENDFLILGIIKKALESKWASEFEGHHVQRLLI